MIVDPAATAAGSRAPSVEAYVVQGPGHDLNAFFQAPEAFDVSMDRLQVSCRPPADLPAVRPRRA